MPKSVLLLTFVGLKFHVKVEHMRGTVVTLLFTDWEWPTNPHTTPHLHTPTHHPPPHIQSLTHQCQSVYGSQQLLLLVNAAPLPLTGIHSFCQHC